MKGFAFQRSNNSYPRSQCRLWSLNEGLRFSAKQPERGTRRRQVSPSLNEGLRFSAKQPTPPPGGPTYHLASMKGFAFQRSNLARLRHGGGPMSLNEGLRFSARQRENKMRVEAWFGCRLNEGLRFSAKQRRRVSSIRARTGCLNEGLRFSAKQRGPHERQ